MGEKPTMVPIVKKEEEEAKEEKTGEGEREGMKDRTEKERRGGREGEWRRWQWR